MSILRSMENSFDYIRFRNQLKEQKFNPGQKAMLNLRLSLLDSCLQGGTLENRVSAHFRKGQLTIIEWVDPQIDMEYSLIDLAACRRPSWTGLLLVGSLT